MSMKKTDIEKQKAKKLAGGTFGTTDRFGKGVAELVDRREQRDRDREQGLVPFAVKLHGDLVMRLHEAAKTRGLGLGEVTAELLEKGLKAK
jgi:hypothetical protein